MLFIDLASAINEDRQREAAEHARHRRLLDAARDLERLASVVLTPSLASREDPSRSNAARHRSTTSPA